MLIVTEGVFSMDGDRAPLGELAALAQQFDAWLMADDAHDLDFGAAARAGVPLRIGTLSKAIGAYGGYLCASQPVIDLVRNRARTVIYTTGLPPSVIAASIAALDLIEREPRRLELPLQILYLLQEVIVHRPHVGLHDPLCVVKCVEQAEDAGMAEGKLAQ